MMRETENIESALRAAVRAAYSLVLDLDDAGNPRVQTLKSVATLGITDVRPWARIRKMLTDDERLIADGIEPDYLLPGSHLELWGTGETSKRAEDIFALFARHGNPNRPRFLSPQVFKNALVEGVSQGILVLHRKRDDGSDRYYWRRAPLAAQMTLEMNVIPAPAATLAFLEPDLLVPGALPDLWPAALGADEPFQPIQRRDAMAYFDGVKRPQISDAALNEAIANAISGGLIAGRTATRAYFKETLPPTLLTGNLELLPAPQPITPSDLLPDTLPGPWDRAAAPPQASLASLADAIASERGDLSPGP